MRGGVVHVTLPTSVSFAGRQITAIIGTRPDRYIFETSG
jgi:hypothetical protein